MAVVAHFNADAHANTLVSSLEAPIHLDVEGDEEDAVIEVVMALNPESEDAYEKAREAARVLLEEYEIRATVVPRTEYWDHLPLGLAPYPRIYVNGELVAVGEVDVEQIVDAVLAMLGLSESRGAAPEPIVPRGGLHNGVAIAAAVA